MTSPITTADNREMRGLWRHLVVDEIRRVPAFLWFIAMYFSGIYGFILWQLLFDESSRVYASMVSPGIKWANSVGLGIGLVGLLLFGRLTGKLYFALPVSRAAYGRYLWFAQVVLPNVVIPPLLVVALWRYPDAPFGVLLILVSIFTLPAAAAAALLVESSFLSFQVPAYSNLFALPLIVGWVVMVAALSIHYLLAVYAGFLWLFLVMIPISCGAVYCSRMALVTPMILAPVRPLRLRLRSLPGYQTCERRLFARLERRPLRAALIRAMILSAALLSLRFCVFKVCQDISFSTTFVAALIPVVFFFDAASFVGCRLSVLLVLPFTPSRLAGAILGYGLGGTIIASSLVAAVAAVTAQDPHTGFPAHLVLLCVSCAAFIPCCLLLVGKAVMILPAAGLFFLLVVSSAAGILPHPSEPLYLPLLAALLSTTLNYGLLRHVLRRMTPGKALALNTWWLGVPMEIVTQRL